MAHRPIAVSEVFSPVEGAGKIDIPTWLRYLPKAELHLHLEGTVTPESLVELSRRHDAEPLTLETARALYVYEDFQQFLMAFKAVSERLQTPDDFEFITSEMIRSLASQGVVHAEVYISWGILHRFKPHLSLPAIMDAIERARVRAEEQFGVSVLWIIDAVRHFGLDEAAHVFRTAAQLRQQYPSIVGIGIGGDEARGSPPHRSRWRIHRAGRWSCKHLVRSQHWR